MKILYKRENHKSYLVLKDTDLEEKIGGRIEESHAYDLRMLCNNPIMGLLPMSVHLFNGETELYYDISTKQSLSILYEKKEMRKEDLEKLFYGMKAALKNMENYLLNMECLVVNPEYIYMHSAEDNVYFLYHPYVQGNFEQTVYDFAEYLLSRICNEDEQAVVYAYGFYRYIKEEKGDLSEALERLLTEKELTQNTAEVKAAEEMWQTADIEEGDLAFYPEDEKEIAEQKQESVDNGKKEAAGIMRSVFFIVLGLGGIGILAFSVWQNNLDWNTVLSQKESIAGIGMLAVGAGGLLLFGLMDIVQKRAMEQAEEIQERPNVQIREELLPLDITYENILEEEPLTKVAEEVCYETVLLEENCYHEQRILTGRVRGRKKQIDLSSFPFVIGKNKEQADYVLEDSSISRIHARFTLRDDIVYLTDLNSTNGTCKNGIRLEPNELVMLEAEDEITFGRVTFTYH
jgi:hypothetical protein